MALRSKTIDGCSFEFIPQMHSRYFLYCQFFRAIQFGIELGLQEVQSTIVAECWGRVTQFL